MLFTTVTEKNLPFISLAITRIVYVSLNSIKCINTFKYFFKTYSITLSEVEMLKIEKIILLRKLSIA